MELLQKLFAASVIGLVDNCGAAVVIAVMT